MRVEDRRELNPNLEHQSVALPGGPADTHVVGLEFDQSGQLWLKFSYEETIAPTDQFEVVVVRNHQHAGFVFALNKERFDVFLKPEGPL